MAKIRLDFVTNSSSSSFIGIFAKISDRNKASQVIEQHKLQHNIKTGREILEEMTGSYFWGYGADWAGVDLTPNKDDIKEDAEYIIWGSYGGAGDCDYAFDKSGYGDMDYDVDLSDFKENEQEIWGDINQNNGFVDIDYGYGAGRNG